MKNELEIKPIDNGVLYKLPRRETAKYRQAGLGLIGSALASSLLFYFATNLLFGVGSGVLSDIGLIISFLFTGLWVFLGVKVLMNWTRQEIRLIDDKLSFKELLFGNFGLTFRCDVRDIESLTVRSAADYISKVKRFVPDAKQIASNNDLKVVQATGEGGTELSFSQFYPVETINELTQDLISRLAKAKSNFEKDDEIEVVKTSNEIRFVMPARDTYNLRYPAILAMIPAGILWLIFVPGILMLLGDGIASFLLYSVALSPLVVGATAVLAFGYRLLNNRTRHEVLINGDRLLARERLIGKVSVSSSCKLKDIKSIRVKPFKRGCRELGVSRFLAPLFGSTYHIVVETDNDQELVLAPAYKIDAVQQLANQLREKLKLDEQAEPANSMDNVDSKPVAVVGQSFGETSSNQLV